MISRKFMTGSLICSAVICGGVMLAHTQQPATAPPPPAAPPQPQYAQPQPPQYAPPQQPQYAPQQPQYAPQQPPEVVYMGPPVVNIGRRHNSLRAAQGNIVNAYHYIEQAQANNDGQLGGHAQKAKNLLVQADVELRMAANVSNREGR